MTVLEKSKFCTVCQKIVSDLTNSSNSEILKKFDLEKEICGRIKLSQFQEINSFNPNPRFSSSKWILALGFGSLLGFTQPAIAQNPISDIEVLEPSLQKVQNPQNIEEKNIINGIVKDEDYIPLPGATVIIKDTNIKTQCDFDGEFSIDLPKEIEFPTLVFKYIGFIDKEFEMEKDLKFIEVIMQAGGECEEVILLGGIRRKRNIFYSIGNFTRKIFKGY